MSKTQFSHFIGIDQTGALKANQKDPRPLKCCLLRSLARSHSKSEQKKWSLSLFSLSKINETTLKAAIESQSSPHPIQKTAIVIDCVSGLPKHQLQSNLEFYELLKEAAAFKAKKSFGRDTASLFFKKVLQDF